MGGRAHLPIAKSIQASLSPCVCVSRHRCQSLAMVAAWDWGAWIDQVEHRVLTDRHEALRNACRRFGRRDQYDYSPEALAAMQPGRRRLLAFMRCTGKMLARMALPPEKGGQGIRLSYEQHRLFNVMRDAMLVRFYGGDTRDYLADLEFLEGITARPGDVYSKVAIILARRSGKTMTQTTVGGVTLLSQPDGNVLEYNMTQDQAKSWFSEAWGRCELLKNDDEFAWSCKAKSDGKSAQFRRHHIKGNHTRLRVYGNARDPRNAQNLRSTGNNAALVCWDEGLFYHPEAYKVPCGRPRVL